MINPEDSDCKTLKGNRDLMIQAMHMYYSDEFYPTEIANSLNIDINELGYYIFGKDQTGEGKNCWYRRKKENNPQKYISTYVSIKPDLIKKTESKIMDLVKKSLEEIEAQDSKLETKDLKALVDSMEKMDKIGRLEDGKATSHTISETATYSLRDIVAKKVEKADIKDVEYKEVDNSKESNDE